MTGLHESTLGLSVYNAIQRGGGMSREQLLKVLRQAWEPALEADAVNEGVAYLLKRKLVTEESGTIAARLMVNGAAATVVRNPVDGTELLVVARKTGKSV